MKKNINPYILLHKDDSFYFLSITYLKICMNKFYIDVFIL